MATTVLVSDATRRRLAEARDAMGAHSMDEAIELLLRRAAASAQELFDNNRTSVLAVCRRRGLKRLVAYGSRVRPDRAPGSDLDLVTDFPAGTSLLDVMKIQDELSAAFGCRVDLGSSPRRDTRLGRHVASEGVVLVGPKG